MLTYLNLDNELIDLTRLNSAERAFLERCIEASRDGIGWLDMIDLVHGSANPVLEPKCRVTATVREHPLYQALRDLTDRVGISTGELLPGPNDPQESRSADPWEDDSAGVPAKEAAEEKGVSVKSIHNAVARGDLIATSGWGSHVSRRSLDRWTIQEHRQRAGRMARTGS